MLNEPRVIPQRPGQARLMGVFNVVPRLILRSPLHGVMSGRLLLLTVTGRKTGRSYTIPVSYVEDGDALLVGAGAPWVKNLRDGVPVSVWLRGKERLVSPEVIRDPAELARLSEIILRVNPTWGRFNNLRFGPDGRIDPDLFERARKRGLAVIRLHLESTETV